MRENRHGLRNTEAGPLPGHGAITAIPLTSRLATITSLMGATNFLLFFHSLLRYAVIIGLLLSIFFAWRGYIFKRPILIGERRITIITVVLCHVQLVLGAILYGLLFESFKFMQGAHQRFWKFEHIGTMVVAIVLITLGRSLAKRAQEESRKHLMVGIFFLLGLLLILWAIPWPHTPMGLGKRWL